MHKNFQIPIGKNALYLLFAVFFTSLVLLYNIQAYPIVLWDESIYAINAIEMAKNNNFLVIYFQGNPDFWNTKPPLLIILQALCIKSLGITELAIRIPSLFATLLTSLLLFYWTKKVVKSSAFSVLSVVLLMFSHSFIKFHGARSGDYDALLVCLTFFASYNYYFYLNTLKNKYLILFFIMLTLAVLTKGIAGLLFSPAWMIATVMSNKTISILKNYTLYLCFFVFTAIICSYYALHELATPGYLNAVINNELGGRFFEVIEYHNLPFYFYIYYLFLPKNHYLDFILLFFLVGGNWFKVKPDVRDKPLRNYLICLIVSFLVVISISHTKIEWYIYPIYPLLAFLTTLFLHGFWLKIKDHKKTFVILLAIALLPCVNYTYHILSTYHIRVKDYYLISFLKSHQFDKTLNGCTVYSSNSKPINTLFYIYQFAQKDIKLNLKANKDLEFSDNSCVLLEKKSLNEIAELYQFKVLEEYNNSYRILLTHKK